QLINTSTKGLKPLTLAAASLLVTPSSAYSDIDKFSKVTSAMQKTESSNYLLNIDDSEELYMLNKRKFQCHLEKWQEDTMFSSSISDIIEHKDFLAIVAMGKKAVPFILDEIEYEPSHLVWALNMIYGRKITNRKNATIADACKLWVRTLRN
ncbi:hypothetical protein, partial [uncultured Bacteroides sp.]|uniref:hypothetical protein n=1 Tax=uncultured Bacteroides sp. TaxID=162156 RepID=UPI0025928CF1